MMVVGEMRQRAENFGQINAQDRANVGAAVGPASSGTGQSLLQKAAARLRRLKRINVNNPGELYKRQLEALAEYDDWPLPYGCEERVAPDYLSGVYVGNRRGIDYARR